MKNKKINYIIFILLFSLKALMANNECSNIQKSIHQLQLKYKSEINQLNLNQRLYSGGVQCKKINNTDFLMLLYDNEDIEEEGIYDLSIIIAEIQNNKILSSNYIPNLIAIDNGKQLSDISINFKDYYKATNNFNIGLIIETNSTSSVNHFIEKRLSIYERRQSTLKPILSKYLIYKLSGTTNGTCQGEFKILTLDNIDYNYPEMQFNFNIIDKIVKNSKCEEIIKFHKKREDKLIYKDMKYQSLNTIKSQKQPLYSQPPIKTKMYLIKGDKVEILEEQDDWLYILYKGKKEIKAWIPRSAISVD